VRFTSTLQRFGNSRTGFVTGGLIRAICLGMRECWLKRDRLINSDCRQLRQSLPISVPPEASFRERKVAFSMHLGASVRTSDPGSRMSVSQLIAAESALFCKNCGEYREYFLRPSVLSNSGSTQRKR
jgi:hypothetical protein